jgi:putative two-component system response regulator
MFAPKPSILVIDDAPESIDVLRGVLSADYQVRACIHGRAGLAIAREAQPDLVLLDVMMPELDGYAVCQALKEDPRTRSIPVIFCTTRSDVSDEARGLALGAVDYITKPYVAELVRARVQTHIALHHQNIALSKQVQERTEELVSTRFEIIRRLARAAEYRDNETGQHVLRMSHYARLVALAYGASEDYAALVLHAAPMHDVGKIGIADSILLKPGALTPAEWQVMRQHPLVGADIIGSHPSELLRAARDVALCHHEKWDGTGYPRGLKHVEIPLIGRIVAIADVFDALLSERPYKRPWTVEDTLTYVKEQRDKHFESAIVDALLKALPEILEIRQLYTDGADAGSKLLRPNVSSALDG